MPRPAVRNRAAPGMVSCRTWNATSPVSWPRLITAPTPKYAFRCSASTSASRITGMCVCVSMIAGITVLPVRSTRAAPAGTFSCPLVPT
jgi:hypothetical protein